MGPVACRVVLVGELITAAFDAAAQYSTEPREIALLATRAVLNMLQRARKAVRLPSTPTKCRQAAIARVTASATPAAHGGQPTEPHGGLGGNGR